MKKAISAWLLAGAAVVALGTVWTVAVWAESRTWTDSTGDYKIQAEFVEFREGKVWLKKKEGGAVGVLMSSLSKADQQFLLGDYVYLGHGHDNGLPVCVELMTGKPAWGPLRGPGGNSAAIVYADGHLYFRYQDGVMALIEATPEEYRLKGSFRIATRHGNSWPHPVIAGGRLYLRDQQDLHVYDIRKPS
jgi:hypothetical protein